VWYKAGKKMRGREEGAKVSKATIVTGLDIGSSKVSAVAAEISDAGALNVAAQSSVKARGIVKGAVADLSDAADSVSKALARISSKLQHRPDNIYVNISGQDVRGEASKGMVPISARGREITRGDIARCVNAAGTIKLPFDREILHTVVHSFSIDDQPAVKDPLGLYASRLSCEAYVISTNTNHMQNIYKCVNSAGYDIKEIVFTGVADGRSVLDECEKEEGVMLLDIGASLTETTVFFQGALAELCTIPSGSDDMKGKIVESAELGAIISRVNDCAADFTKRGGAIRSIVLTGGMAFSDNIVETIEEGISLKVPVKIGAAKGVRGELSSVDSMVLVTAIGLVKYGAEKHGKKAAEKKNLVRNLSEKVVDIFNNYF
jgi:cell division protein FtsA